MKMYEVHQIDVEEEISDATSRLGYEGSRSKYPVLKAQDDTIEGKNIVHHFRAGHFKLVAKIRAEDLSNLWMVGQIGPEEKITRIGYFHSLTVGNVVKDENGTHYQIGHEGFEEIIP